MARIRPILLRMTAPPGAPWNEQHPDGREQDPRGQATRSLQSAADEHGLGRELYSEPVTDAVAHLPRQGEEIARGATAPVAQREHVLAGDADPPARARM